MSKDEVRQLFEELSIRFTELSDSDFDGLFSYEEVVSFLSSILNTDRKKIKKIGDFFQQNKNRSVLIANFYHALFFNHSIRGVEGKIDGYVSPMGFQFPEGVMIMEGKNPWTGYPVWWKDGVSKYGISKRDYHPGDMMNPRDLKYISQKEFRKLLISKIEDPQKIEDPINELTLLLANESQEESDYQTFFENHPWFLGADYKKVQSLRKFDDTSIPDFTAVRAFDSFRDIIEIKQPFLNLFTKKDKLNSNFNNSWNQAEGYLLYARENQDFLTREKGFKFSNPKCILIAGYNLTAKQVKAIRSKERIAGTVTFHTYNEILNQARNYLEFSKKLKDS